MNILSAEEMNEAEQLFSSIPIDPLYKLRLPTDKEYQNISTFQSHIFPAAPAGIQRAAQKMISLSDNMRSLSQNQPNSTFHMLTYTLISILYQDKCNSTTEVQNNLFLLQTIKCSLYSKDVDFKLIRNVPANYQTKQLKLMAYQFFAFMVQPSLSIKTSRSKCAQWILTHNPMLMITFTLFLRFILTKIGIEQADDYRKGVNNQQAVTNLIEYFDLHYRSFGELILFYEDGIFLAMFEKQIVVGQYYENESQKQSQKQQLQIKSSVKLNMIESFLVNVNDKPQKTEVTQNNTNKKKGIVQSDMKLFNFMLQSSSQEGTSITKEKQNEMETPHFKDGNQQFQFLRKKKSGEFKPQEIRNQFQRLIMDQSQQYIQEDDIAPTPYLGGQNQFAFTNNNAFAHKQQLNSPQVIDSPIDELNAANICQNPFKQNTRSSVQYDLRRSAQQNQKYLTMFTGVAQVKQTKQMFASVYTDRGCLNSNAHKINKRMEWSEMAGCGCRKIKLTRNNMNSKVVEISVVPVRSRPNFTGSIVSAKRLQNYKVNQQNNKQQEQIAKQRVKQYNTTSSKVQQKKNMQRKPAFLKNLKKNKPQATPQDFTKSLVNQPKKYTPYIHKQVSQQRINYHNLTSCIQDIPDSHITRSTPKHYQHKSVKTVSDLGDREQNGNQINNMSTYRSGITKAWQTNSNFIQKVPEYAKISQVKTSQMSTPNVGGGSSTSPLKFFAPVQIIAPTVYVNSNNTASNNNIVFKLNDIKGRVQANPEANSSRKELVGKGKYNGRQF